MRRRSRTLLGLAAAAACLFSTGCEQKASVAPETHTKVFLSAPLPIDKKYRSMEGPAAEDKIRIQPGDDRTLWITGVKVDLTEDSDGSLASPEYMCHANIDVKRWAKYREDFEAAGVHKPRIITLSQGQTEAFFPAGFGYPVKGETAIALYSQVLNLNEEEIDKTIRQKIHLDYVYEDEAQEMKALFPVDAYAMVALNEKYKAFGVKQHDTAVHGQGCLVATTAVGPEGQTMHTEDQFGQVFSGHWMVPPGRQIVSSNVTNLLQIPYDTTVHHIAVHLHPYAESLELRNVTTGESVFKAMAENYEDKVGLKSVEFYSSAEASRCTSTTSTSS